MNDIIEFAKKENKRLKKLFNLENDPTIKYKHLAKLMEEVGELSEAILKGDKLQRQDKLEELKSTEGEEIADLVICALILGDDLGVDLKASFEKSMKKIDARYD